MNFVCRDILVAHNLDSCVNVSLHTVNQISALCHLTFFPLLAGCGCHPGGTEGDCDSLFGTCICRPGAMGVLCNECIDGYWGISQGCVPCDCCTNGTVDGSDVCDKVD